ncbi:MAG: hypothetical protein A3H72_00965 [Candidatus Doudnabacteria bacterium RIFCSPLOWO2_02_FULL_48_8]|uniref:Uncharacterized protein n=1 Tax=Candidatus Doudnabacteria bacterium RIFCSPHIGHO2_01_FULL_46_24 TaxID=1817825 RepID=A0A1F5NVB1_9BACT|nr:MAG: hypothetical protein A2720_00785 [Candidatus Doudnabacteria bacterium RIFCSPHIGHO2_01_FULL_46_24]OGE95402.1 MAG: hypothetical protein A3H72_00965 [Candidatus Doudnabacteria bacterium RIFCSPLOWO2_02_FULL_48_8]OGE96004.1 MAG: hypothetical protein A3E98_04250 [Candidatus Doudnabacteria bacterium RIFCSPHIGHO2_12_FULL_48_11]
MVIGASLIYSIPAHDFSFAKTSGRVTGEINPGNKNAEIFDGYYPLKLAWENFSPTECNASDDLGDIDEILKNCTYTVGTNWTSMWTVKLSEGYYGFTPEGFHNNNDYDDVGPWQVSFERSVEGDLDKNGKDDAVVILRLNYGGSGSWLNMIILIQLGDGYYEQTANYMFEDREVIRGLSVDNGIITVRIIVKDDNDSYCCPSVYDTYRFRITD